MSKRKMSVDPDLDPKVESAIGEFCCCPQRFCKQICDALVFGSCFGSHVKQACWHSRRSKACRGLPKGRMAAQLWKNIGLGLQEVVLPSCVEKIDGQTIPNFDPLASGLRQLGNHFKFIGASFVGYLWVWAEDVSFGEAGRTFLKLENSFEVVWERSIERLKEGSSKQKSLK